jgi:hypothetical protein
MLLKLLRVRPQLLFVGPHQTSSCLQRSRALPHTLYLRALSTAMSEAATTATSAAAPGAQATPIQDGRIPKEKQKKGKGDKAPGAEHPLEVCFE